MRLLGPSDVVLWFVVEGFSDDGNVRKEGESP